MKRSSYVLSVVNGSYRPLTIEVIRSLREGYPYTGVDAIGVCVEDMDLVRTLVAEAPEEGIWAQRRYRSYVKKISSMVTGTEHRALILIGLSEWHMVLGHWARKRQIPVVIIAPHGCDQFNPREINFVAECGDRILTLLPEPSPLAQEGVPPPRGVNWLGLPGWERARKLKLAPRDIGFPADKPLVVIHPPFGLKNEPKRFLDFLDRAQPELERSDRKVVVVPGERWSKKMLSQYEKVFQKHPYLEVVPDLGLELTRVSDLTISGSNWCSINALAMKKPLLTLDGSDQGLWNVIAKRDGVVQIPHISATLPATQTQDLIQKYLEDDLMRHTLVQSYEGVVKQLRPFSHHVLIEEMSGFLGRRSSGRRNRSR